MYSSIIFVSLLLGRSSTCSFLKPENNLTSQGNIKRIIGSSDTFSVCSWNFLINETMCAFLNFNNVKFDFSNNSLYRFPLRRASCERNGGTFHSLANNVGLQCNNSNVREKSSLRNTQVLENVAPQESFLSQKMLTHPNEDKNLELFLLVLMNMVLSANRMYFSNTSLAVKLMASAMINLEKSVTTSCDEVKRLLILFLICSDIILDYVQSQSVYNKVLFHRSELGFINERITVNSLSKVNRILSRCLIGKKETILQTTKVFLWVKRDEPRGFQNLSNVLKSKNAFFKIPKRLQTFLARESDTIVVEFMTFDNFHQFSDKKICLIMPPISLSIRKVNGEYFQNLSSPVELFFKYKLNEKRDLWTTGFARMPPKEESTFEIKDNFVSVHRLMPLHLPGSGKILIKFHNLNRSSFKVLIVENIRPDWEMMTLFSKKVSAESLLYEVNLKNQNSESMNYIGILLEDGKGEYSFETRYIQCHSYLEKKWRSVGCSVGTKTNETIVQCYCWHLSMFGGSASIVPKELDLNNDLKLLVSVKDNPKTLVVLVSILLLYFVMLVWTRHNDNKDRLQRFVVVLEDNFPGEEWPYLITVYTSFWINAGTNSNIGIRLYGSEGMSRIHNFKSSSVRQVLKANCDDWFLIFTPKPLGDIKKIHIFSDYSGRSPDWYCKKIMVYDLRAEKDFKFLVNKWIALSEESDDVDFIFRPTFFRKKLRRDRIALDNIIFGLRETHLLLSIFTRHPRSSVTRSQRLSICVCILVVNMLTSIMFHDLVKEAFPEYSDSKQEIVIQMESSLISAPFTFIIIFCFKKSRIVTAPKSDVPITLTSTQPIPLESGLITTQVWDKSVREQHSSSSSSSTSESFAAEELFDGDEIEEEEEEEEVEEEVEEEQSEIEEGCCKSCYKQIKALLFQVITFKSVMPVKIADEDEESSHLRTKWMYFSWLLCELAIIFSTFFVLLYSVKMEPESSSKWMKGTIKHSLLNIFLMSPLKIIIFAVILAGLYGQLQYISSYQCNTESAIKRKKKGNEKFLQKILEIRKNKWYKPLKSEKIKRIRKKERNWQRWRATVNCAVIIIIYIILKIEVQIQWLGLYVTTRYHIRNMFSADLLGITYEDYLVKVVVPAIDKRVWYNGTRLMNQNFWNQEMGFTNDYATRLIGYPRIRQQRVKPGSCKIRHRIAKNLFQECSAPLTLSTIDKEDYALSWSQPEKSDLKPSSPWVYAYPTTALLWIYSLKTEKFYFPGGYVAKLPYVRTGMESQIKELIKNEWIDNLSRVVFFEMVIYNANTNLVTYEVLVFEKLADGSYHFHTLSKTLHPQPSSLLVNLLCIFIIGSYYLLRIFLLFNRLGLKYLFSWTGILDIFLIAVLTLATISYSLYHKARTDYLMKWQVEEEDDLELPLELLIYRDLIRYETAILVIIVPAQVLHGMRFGKKVSVNVRIWSYCFKFAIILGMSTLFYHHAFQLMSVIFNTKTGHCFFNRSFNTLSYCKQIYTPSSLSSWPALMFWLHMNVISAVMCVFILHGYSLLKLRSKYTENFNMATFLGRKLKHVWNRKVCKMFRRSRGTKRLRAGVDKPDSEDEQVFPTNRTLSYTQQICEDLSAKVDSVLDKLLDLEQDL